MPDLLLYDGTCGLCSRLVRFVLARDAAARFRFAPLQEPLAAELLGRHGRAPDDDTVYVVADLGGPAERVLARSRAVIHVLASLGGPWRLARALEVLPVRALDAAYALVARHRHRWSGRREVCALPPRRSDGE